MTTHPPRPRRPDDDVPVLVVGAGPAGLAAATALAAHGVRALVVDRRAGVSTQPKATALSLRTAELMRGWGLTEQVRAGSVAVEWRLLAAPTMARAAEGDLVDVGLPTAAQSALVSPEQPVCVPQDHVETVLLRHLSSLGVPVLRGVAVRGLQVAADGARATLVDAATGDGRTVTARYLVGADGVHGPVREALGIRAHGHDLLHQTIGASFHAPLWDVLGGHRYGIYVTTEPGAESVLLPAGPGDRWFFATDLPPGVAPSPSAMAETAVVQRIRAAVGLADLPVRVDRTGRTVYATSVAETFRRDSAFLAGDAAHRVSPRGGTGLNMAVQDGADLGWKLAWVLRGHADPALLDTYETERRPQVEHNAARSEQPDGSRRGVDTELRVDLGGRITHLSLPGNRSTLDLAGRGLALLTGPSGDRWRAAAVPAPGAVPVDVHELDAITVRALGVVPGGALLLRPDAVPVALLRDPAELPPAAAAATAGSGSGSGRVASR